MLNSDDPCLRDRKLLFATLNRLTPDQLAERALCGIINRVREEHPHVTKTFSGLWISLMRACCRAHSSLRYPHQLEKVWFQFDEALLFKFNEVDHNADDFDLDDWITENEEAVGMVVDLPVSPPQHPVKIFLSL